MTKRKKPTLGRALINLVIGVPTLLSLIGKIVSIIGFEARLAGRSLVSILMLTIISALLLTSIWLCMLAMLFVYLYSLQWPIPFILLTLIGVNLILLVIISIKIMKHKKRLLLPETHQLIDEARNIYNDL